MQREVTTSNDADDSESSDSDNEDSEGDTGVGMPANEDNSDDDEDDTALVEDTIGPAPEEPPTGFRYAPHPPPLVTDADLLALVRRYVLHAFDQGDVRGWYMGRISARGVSAAELRRIPTANFVVTYDKKHTNNKNLHGRVASSLTADKYGKKEWWLLLEENV